MSVSTARARGIVAELLAAQVRDVVLAPGSRSAPLALALAAAERVELLRLHVRVDERSAGYLALGLAKASGHPVAVVTTSGTAAVNLHPSVVEASYAGIPLVAITADRPALLRATGANQTIDQSDVFGRDVRWRAEVDVDDVAAVRSIVSRALAVATDPAFAGPVHLNVPLPMPLVPDDDWAPARPEAPWTRAHRTPVAQPTLVDDLLPADVDVTRGLIVVGDQTDGATADLVRDLAAAARWPVISEPSGGCTAISGALAHGPLLLGDAAWRARMLPDVVLTVGRVGLSRAIGEVTAAAAMHIAVDPRPLSHLADPTRTARVVVPEVPQSKALADTGWAREWTTADARAAEVVAMLDSEVTLSGPTVARSVAASATRDELLVIGPSWPIRHVAAYGGPIAARVLANRGTSGIDGVVSTAWGAALAHHELTGGRTVCLLGDLTALYDRNGLLPGAGEAPPPLTYVVADNDGGGIFSALEQGAPRFSDDFERVFGTPHGGDLAELLAAPGVEVLRVHDRAALVAALGDRTMGPRIVVAQCGSRADERDQVTRLADAVATRLAEAATP